MDVVEEMTGARSRCEAASSAASEMEIALAFLLRVLKANFLGGLKVARMVCSFSDRALTACAAGLARFLVCLFGGMELVCYLAVGSLVVCWDIARSVFDLVGEPVDACEAVVYGIIAFAAARGDALQAVHLLL